MKRIVDLVFSFLQGFTRWLGIGLALIVILATFAAISESAYDTAFKITSQPTKGFEVTPWKGQSAVLLLRINHEIGGLKINAEKIKQLLQATQGSQLKGHVKAILLEIDSGGGESNNSEAIYHMIDEFKNLYHVPVYAYVDGYCCSGAYMIACAADKIVATDYSTIGSIGVRMQQFNFSEALKKIGVQPVSFRQGLGKDALNPFEPLNEEDRKHIDPILESAYERFLTIVSTNRSSLNKELLRDQIGARIYDAPEALRIGYIDSITSNRSAALVELVSKANLEQGYALIELKPTMGISDWLVSDQASQSLMSIVQMIAKAFF